MSGKIHGLLAAAALLLAACTTVPVFKSGTVPGDLIHQDSGFLFPARVGSFARVQIHQYDDRGRDISVGYSGDIPVVVTVYVYPADGRDLEAEVRARSAEVLAAYPGALVLGRRSIQVTPGGIEAEAVYFTFAADFQGKQQQLASELVVAQRGSRFVKYRISFPEDTADIASEDVSRFLARFSWP